MRLGRHQINDQRWRRPLALPENQRKCLLEVGTTVEIDTDNACSLGLHFRWLDGSPESYILKWLDTWREGLLPEANKIGASTPYDFEGRNLTAYGGLLPVATMLEKLEGHCLPCRGPSQSLL